MFALGQVIGELKGVQQRQDTTNGKVIKATDDIVKIKEWQSTNDGKERGISKQWIIIFQVITSIGVVVSIYLALHK